MYVSDSRHQSEREGKRKREGERKETPRQYKQECVRREDEKKKNQGRLGGSSVAHRPQAELVEGRAKLRNHPGGLRPHEILTGLLGQGASLGGLVIHVLRLVGMLIVILHDTGRDITGTVLLA